MPSPLETKCWLSHPKATAPAFRFGTGYRVHMERKQRGAPPHQAVIRCAAQLGPKDREASLETSGRSASTGQDSGWVRRHWPSAFRTPEPVAGHPHGDRLRHPATARVRDEAPAELRNQTWSSSLLARRKSFRASCTLSQPPPDGLQRLDDPFREVNGSVQVRSMSVGARARNASGNPKLR